MKTFLHWFSLCLTVTATFAAAPRTDEPAGIKFFTGSWKAVLAEAKRQNKPVFVDIYTTWCGPCKLMAKEAFPNPQVGEKFNSSFINYQLDAEKGEGIEVAKKYAVDAYPTALYVSASGDLIYRAVGYEGIRVMMEEADRALTGKRDTYTLTMMEQDYAAGKRDTAFLAAYLKKRASEQKPDNDALMVYLKAIPKTDWTSNAALNIIAGNVERYSEPLMAVLFPKMLQLVTATDGETVSLHSTIGRGVRAMNEDHFKQAISKKDETILAEVIKVNEAYLEAMRGKPIPPDRAEQIANGYRNHFRQQTTGSDK
ncbi:thioredoxin family protein [Spirosoma rhododendri]|uniref:thioredoxin family protein n=1 Tax=Spirosoma rhododendri TaxID=2728024 RepID=UPI001C2C0281|nr:thioredoxin family protein [Spirosoma rhododendri]